MPHLFHRARAATRPALAAALVLPCAWAAAAPPMYTYQVVEGTRGATTAAVALSDTAIAGVAWAKHAKQNKPHSVVATRGDVVVFTPDGAFSQATAVNNVADVVGGVQVGQGQVYLRTADGTITRPLDPFGFAFSGASGINSSRTIIGGYAVTGTVTSPFSYHDGVLTTLPTLGFESNTAAAINDAGTIVGTVQSGPDSQNYQAVTWTNGVLATLPPLHVGDSTSARGISSNGLVAGQSGTPHTTNIHAVLWSGGAPTDLGDLGGATHFSQAAAVNASGDVVGYSIPPVQDGNDAFLYTQGRMYKLSDLVPGLPRNYTISSGLAINDAGVILVNCRNNAEKNFSMLLTPMAPAQH